MRRQAIFILLTAAICILGPASVWSTARRIIYVDDSAIGANDGSSWTNAYRYLQDALTTAKSAQGSVEIRIAQGIYKPDQYTLEAPSPIDLPLDRSKDKPVPVPLQPHYLAFRLYNGAVLRGGYGGVGAPDPNARDVAAHKTILSGDLLGNDVQVDDPCDLPTQPCRAENSRNILWWRGGEITVTLDGLIIRGATASALLVGGGRVDLSDCTFMDNASLAGGAVCLAGEGTPTLTRCTFTRNWADSGGALYADCWSLNGTVRLAECCFAANGAKNRGGSAYFGEACDVQMERCTFADNTAGAEGGAMSVEGHSYSLLLELRACFFQRNVSARGGAVCWWGNTHIDGCRFFMNRAALSGGAVEHRGDELTIANSAFTGNSAGEGGALLIDADRATVTNTILTGNRARQLGGAIGSRDSAIITCCTFLGNTAADGRAFACLDSGPGQPARSLTMNGCIIQDAGSEISNTGGAHLELLYNDIHGSWLGPGNMDVDPCFAAAGYWDAKGTPDDPNDDAWMEGDYHLKSEAGRWDPDRQSWVQDAVTSLCVDAGDPYSSFARELWPHGQRVNLGAYGNTPEASMSKLPSGSVADLNQDSFVRLPDFSRLAQRWLSPGPLLAEDLNRDERVDHGDLQILARAWLSEPLELRFVDYWPFALGSWWTDVDPESEGGHSITCVERFAVKGFDVWAIEWGGGGARGPSSSTHFYVYVNGNLYKVYSRADLDRLPDISTWFFLEWPEIIQPGRPFLCSQKGMLTPVRTTLRQLAPQFDAHRSRPLLTAYREQDYDRDVLAFMDARGETVYAFGRDYGPILMDGGFMRRSDSVSK